MQTQTKMFVGLVVAMIVLLAFAWYTWPATPSSTVDIAQNVAPTASSTAVTTPTATHTALATSSALYPPPSLGERVSTMSLGGQTIYIDLAVNEAQQALGLGNRPGLGAHQGMLFIFPDDEIHMFWMKDMSFSIDMIWLDANGTVMFIVPNVSPDTYPQDFGPNYPSRYVLEVPANFAVDHGINVGNKATLP